MCADRLAEDYNYEWEEREDNEPDLYECDHCHTFVLEDDLQEYKDMVVCSTCFETAYEWDDDFTENA